MTGNWNASFYLTGVLLILPAILMTIEPLIIPSQNKDKPNDIEDTPKNGAPVKLQTLKSDPSTSEKETESLLNEADEVEMLPESTPKKEDANQLDVNVEREPLK